MANPFPTKFVSKCQICEVKVFEGDLMFAYNKQFICEMCATENGIVCGCGKIKKIDFKTCWDCYEEERKKKKVPPIL